jgi:hypothetical protein
MQLVKICFEKLVKLKSFIADSVSKQRKLERQACRNGNTRRADVAAAQMQKGTGWKTSAGFVDKYHSRRRRNFSHCIAPVAPIQYWRNGCANTQPLRRVSVNSKPHRFMRMET